MKMIGYIKQKIKGEMINSENSTRTDRCNSKQSQKESTKIVCECDFSKKPLERIEKGKVEAKFQAIIRGLRHINDILGHVPRYVIGLSGGIDSAVVASLLTIAVGKENVIAVNMPTKYNKQVTKDIAKHVAEKLGIEYVVIPITELVELF